MNESINLDYPKLLALFEEHLVDGRTESQAMLIWFLENYYRLDEVMAQDSVCDGPGDMGVDGVYVDDNLETIDVLQCRISKSNKKTLGDTQLKELLGTISQFRNSKTISRLLKSTGNRDLIRLIEDEEISNKIMQGYEVRGIFITNINRDKNARNLLASQASIMCYDKSRLQKLHIPTGPTQPIDETIEFDVFGYDVADYRIPNYRVVIAAISAIDLVKMDGISSGLLFDWNVRQSLGMTKVNKDIAKSIGDEAEHQFFLLYHNGLTIVCDKIEHKEDKLSVSKFMVVNGCQSLTTLYRFRKSLSESLRIPVKFIEVASDTQLVAKITHHTNNQNAIKPRDLQSNSVIQRRIKSEFESLYPENINYRMKRGEQFGPEEFVVDNEDAAKVLLAFDLKEPWGCHQTYKLFEDLHAQIFGRPEVTASRIASLMVLYEFVRKSLDKIEDRVFAKYTLTKFFLLFVLREALETDARGREFIRHPDVFVHDDAVIDRLESAIMAILGDLIIDLNADIAERKEKGEPLDHKRELKSISGVRALAGVLIPQYQKQVARGRIFSFSEDLEKPK